MKVLQMFYQGSVHKKKKFTFTDGSLRVHIRNEHTYHHDNPAHQNK